MLILQKENDWNEKTQSAIIRTVKTSAQQKKMKGTNRRWVKKNRELIYWNLLEVSWSLRYIWQFSRVLEKFSLHGNCWAGGLCQYFLLHLRIFCFRRTMAVWNMRISKNIYTGSECCICSGLYSTFLILSASAFWRDRLIQCMTSSWSQKIQCCHLHLQDLGIFSAVYFVHGCSLYLRKKWIRSSLPHCVPFSDHLYLYFGV